MFTVFQSRHSREWGKNRISNGAKFLYLDWDRRGPHLIILNSEVDDPRFRARQSGPRKQPCGIAGQPRNSGLFVTQLGPGLR
jgi:hypothetical protein